MKWVIWQIFTCILGIFVLYLDYKDADLCLLLLSYNTSVLYKIVISIFMDMADSHANKYITSENVRNY